MYNFTILKEASINGYSNRRLYLMRQTASQEVCKEVASVSSFLEKGHKVLMIGEGTHVYTRTRLLMEISNTDCLVVLQLELEQESLSLTQKSKEIADIDVINTAVYWTLKLNNDDMDGRKARPLFVVQDVEAYKALKAYKKGFKCSFFEEYFVNMDKCSQIKVDLEEKNYKEFLIYPGRTLDTNNAVTAVIFPKQQQQMSAQDIHRYEDELDVVMRWPSNNKENSLVNEYLLQTNTRLSYESMVQIKTVIDKYTSYLMNAHTNLNIIKPSSVRSTRRGTTIETEECIALYCSGKGIIPLLETEFPRQLDGIRTDVREVSVIFRGVQDYQKSLSMGLSIGMDDRGIGVPSKFTMGKSGTLGPFVEEVDSGNNVVSNGFLTCSHLWYTTQTLLKDFERLQHIQPPRPCILQPSVEDNKLPNNKLPVDTTVCGEACVSFCGHVEIDTKPVGVDVSYVRIIKPDRAPITASFPYLDNTKAFENGYVQFPNISGSISNMTPDIFNRNVHKCGRSTGYTRGMFSEGEVHIKIFEDESQPNSKFILLQNQFSVIGRPGLFSGGDSGSSVLVKYSDTEYRVFGIAFSGTSSEDEYYVSPIWAVLEALNQSGTSHVTRIKSFPFHPQMEQ